MALKTYNSDAELLAEPKEVLVEIIKQLHCTLELPEIKPYLIDWNVKRQIRECTCCRPFCCLQVDL